MANEYYKNSSGHPSMLTTLTGSDWLTMIDSHERHLLVRGRFVFTKSLYAQRKPHRPNNMASVGDTQSLIFHNANSPNFEPNKSFYIRSILDLPEESVEERALPSSNSSSVETCPVSRLPLVPRAVCPMVHQHADNVPPSGLMNWQDFGVALWSYRALPFKNKEFQFGPIFPKKKRRPMRKKKQRPLFSPHQIQMMEKEFAKQRYISEDNRARLALEINLTETQVKTWFKNRRTSGKRKRKMMRAQRQGVPRVFLATCSIRNEFVLPEHLC